MEKARIPMFDRFNLISHVMPFYGYTHKAFLVLSILCSASRHKLDEYYFEFIQCMKENCFCINKGLECSVKHLYLPNDLFNLTIVPITEQNIYAFIKYIENIRLSNGCYFKGHYMHSQIKISDPILIDRCLIEKLHPYLATLQSIRVKLYNKQNQETIAISEADNFEDTFIPQFVYGDIKKINPHFKAFKRISCIDMEDSSAEYIVKNLNLAIKASVMIDSLLISNIKLKKLTESNQCNISDLKVNSLRLFNDFESEMSNKIIEFLNDINPNSLSIINFNCYCFDYLQILSSMNSPNIEIETKNEGRLCMTLTFMNTQSILLDSITNQRLHIKSKSTAVGISIKGIENLQLFNVDTDYQKDSTYLFIPLESILKLELTEYKTVLSSTELCELFRNLDIEMTTKPSGVVIPLKFLAHTFFHFEHKFVSSIKINQDIINEVLKVKHVDCEVKFLSDLMEISKLFPESYSHINYFFNMIKTTGSIKTGDEMINVLDYIKPKIKSLQINYKLFGEELEFVRKLIVLSRTRYCISQICLKFSFLSELLSMLSLCTKCPELRSINLSYTRSETKNEQEEIDIALKEFKRNFGFICFLEIKKSKN